jgi:hypothetical protein
MNHSSEIATVLYTGAGLVALWLTLGCYRSATTDKFRQNLFALRAELFDYARGDAVRFDNGSYLRLRNLLNSMIRFAHSVSFVRLAVAIVWENFSPVLRDIPSFPAQMENDGGLSEEARKKLADIHERMFRLTFTQILSTSVAALPVLVVYVAYQVLRDGISVWKHPPEKILDHHRLNEHIQLIEQQAVETRDEQMRERLATVGV